MFKFMTLLLLVAITAVGDADFEALKTQAETGDAKAQFELGMAYSQGEGVEQNLETAVQWVRKAADQDYGPAVVSMVYRYEKGEGVKQNLDEATRWYEKAMTLGYDRNLKKQEELKDHETIFAEMDAGLRRLPDSPGDHYVAWMTAAIEAKGELRLAKEVDSWLESLAADFSNDWKMLRAIAMGYHYATDLGNYYFLIKNNGSVAIGNSKERNRWLGLKLMEKAYALAQTAQASDPEMAALTRDYLVILLEPRFDDLKMLQLKTTDLEVKEVAAFNFGDDLSNEMIFFTHPASLADAANDGELIRSLLGRYDLTIGEVALPKEIQLSLAAAGYVEIMSESPRLFNKDWEFWHNLGDDEYAIWRSGEGVSTKRLTDDFVYLPKLIIAAEEQPEIIGTILGSLFQNRHQLERAAVYFEMAGDTNKVRSIRANQGTFVYCQSRPVGVETTVEYIYRNGEEVAIELYHVNVGSNLFQRLEANVVMHSEFELLKGNTSRFRDTGGFDNSEMLEKVDAFVLALNPISDHRDASTNLNFGALDAGCYLVRAKLKDGNESETILNIRDTMLYTASIPSEKCTNTLFILCDARTGAPLPNETIQLLELKGGTHRDENREPIDGPYAINWRLEGVTDSNGCYVLEEHLLRQPEIKLNIIANLDGFPLVMESSRWDRKQISPRNGSYQKPFIATDRPIYKPSDEGDLMIWQGTETNAFKVRIRENDSKFELPIAGEPNLHPNLFGAMKAKFTIPEEARLGEYEIEQVFNEGAGFEMGALQVEKYRAPEFKVAIQQLDGGQIEISATYAYGAPVAGGRVSGFIEFDTSSPSPWYPTSPYDAHWYQGYWWNGDQFDVEGISESYDHYTIFSDSFNLTLDANGIAVVDVATFKGGEQALAATGRFNVRAEVMDAANKEYDATERFLNNRKAATPGCWADKAFFEQGEKIAVHTATKEEGELTLHYERISGTNAVEVSEMNIMESGLYQVKARDTAGADSRPFQFFVLGDADNGLSAKNPIRIVVEKGVYDADETATILVQVDQPGRHVYFFERLTGQNAYSIPRAFVMDQTSKRIKLPINGAAGEWQCAAMTMVNGRRHMKAGKIYAVEKSKKSGRVDISTDQPTYEPGATVKVELRALNTEGEGEPCAVAITVYNKMLDRLVRQSSERAIFKSLFSSWIDDGYHALRFKDGWPRSIVSYDPRWVMRRLGSSKPFSMVTKSEGVDDLFGDAGGGSDDRFGGMESDGTGSETAYMREDLADHAYWNAFVETDENGQATVEFPLPDTMTEWKVMAWAVHTNFAASGETSFKCAKDLVVQLNTPRFMVEGDELEISASVRNHTTNTLTVIARTSLSMLSTVIKAFEPGAEKLLYWTYTARKPGTEDVKVMASARGIGDGVSQTLPILPHSMLKRGGDSGILTENQNTVQIEIDIPEAVDPESLVLDMNASPNMLETVAGAQPFLAEYPHGCTEQTLNKFLPAVVVLQTLETLGLQLEDLAAGMPPERAAVYDRKEILKCAQSGMERLIEAQNRDGFWSWNMESEYRNSDPLVTAWTARGLHMASKQDELEIDPKNLNQTVDKMVGYLTSQFAPPWRRNKKIPLSQTDVLTAVVLQELDPEYYIKRESDLKAARELMPTVGPFLMKHASELSLYGKTLLAYFFELRGETAPRDELIAYIEQYLETDPNLGTFWLRVKSDQYWLWHNDEIEIMAWYLKLLNRVEPNGAKTAGVARWLLINRQHGDHWKSTRDTAICVEALCEFIVNNPTAAKSGSVEALLNGASVELGLKPGMNTLKLTSNSAHPTFFDVAWQFQTLENPIAAERCDLVAVSRAYYRMGEKSDERTLLGKTDVLKAGETIEVEISFEAPQELEYLLATDFKPAGFECIETQSGYRHDGLRHYQEIHDERVACYINRLPKGISSIRYRLRAEHAGRVCAMPATIELMYAPKKAANSAEDILQIER